MNTHEGGMDVLRIQIEVSGETYRSLVAGLRGQSASSSPSRQTTRTVKALVDFDVTSRHFSVSSLGNHKLPRSIAVRPGSETHNNLARIIDQSLADNSDQELRELVAQIVAALPRIQPGSLRVNRRDIEFLPNNSTINLSPGNSPRIIASIAPTILLDLDDSPTLVIPDQPRDQIAEAVKILRAGLRVVTPPVAIVAGNFVEMIAKIRLPSLPAPADISVHWGSYEDLAPVWQDEQILTIEGGTARAAHSLYFRSHVPLHGWYGATFFVQVRGSNERIWIGGYGSSDARFYIHSDDDNLTKTPAELFRQTEETAREQVRTALGNISELARVTREIESNTPHLSVTALLRDELAGRSDEEEIIAKITNLTEDELGNRLARMIRTHYGVGEIVFATPEGHQAAAGGLAQVISGLPPELCETGIPVTIITPMYRHQNGNKHAAAETLLEEGISIDSERVIPRYVGSVSVALGPTYHAGTSWFRRAPSTIPLKVYLAQKGKLRIFLLTNNAAFDRVYQPVYADEQLRRALILSRAVLETIATPHFGIRPSAIISNDWMTACVPALSALDQRYQSIPWLASAKTIHMIHNGGADYHGRLPFKNENEDLWPMFNLAPEHFFGFRDSHRYDLLNFTMAASQHVSGGVITVSQPYARQLLSPTGGDGLEYVLNHKRGSVYGVSNGINRRHIDSYLSALTQRTPEELRNSSTLLTAKARIREIIQRRYGLQENSGARLISFVGRLAEQKGLALLSGFVEHAAHSTLEDLLVRHENTQILVAGPLTNGDASCDALRGALSYLQAKYPGRIAALYDYIPHSTALELMFGSSLFLMPSRFEPGGITQLEALAAGTLVIGRNVGGISATIRNFNPQTGDGTGFLCDDYSATGFANTAHWALTTIQDSATYSRLVEQAVRAHHSWSDRAPAFTAVVQKIVLGDDTFNTLSATTENRLLAALSAACSSSS